VPVVCGFCEDFVFFDQHCGDVCADAMGFWFHFVEFLKEADVFVCDHGLGLGEDVWVIFFDCSFEFARFDYSEFCDDACCFV